MAARGSVKSILKQPSDQPTTKGEQKAKVERDRNNLKIALYHAYKIQDQKNVQAEILKRVEDLIDLPSSIPFTLQEARHFTSAVQIFQPSDLEDLVDERRIEGRCGYVLCSNAPRAKSAPTWKVGRGGANYCTVTCMRKMLYVKTQLSEVPAWERASGEQPEVVLHDDDRLHTEITQGPAGPMRRQLKVDDEELAFERGETKASFRPQQVMTDKIVEKAVTNKPNSIPSQGRSSHQAVEGYEPRNYSKKQRKMSSSDNESEDDA